MHEGHEDGAERPPEDTATGRPPDDASGSERPAAASAGAPAQYPPASPGPGVAQPPPGGWQWLWTPQGWQLWWQWPPGQPPPGQPPPGQVEWVYSPFPGAWQPQAAPEPASGERRGVYGIDLAAAPGQVPWGWRAVLAALGIAFSPIIALLILTASLGSKSTTERTAGVAVAATVVALTIVQDGWFLVWAWFFSIRRWRLPWGSLGFRRPGARIFWMVPTALVVVYVLYVIAAAAYDRLLGPPPEQNFIPYFPHSVAGLALFAFLVLVVAPFFEETVFRGFVFQGLASAWGPVPGAIVSAMLFAAIHEQASVLVPFFFLGLALAGVFYWTKSIWANIALHAAFNSIGVLVWALTK